jgi:hypothetical protein
MEQFNQSLNNMIQNTEQNAVKIRNAIHDLNMIITRLRDINREMTRQGMNDGQEYNGYGNNNNDGNSNNRDHNGDNGLGGP